MNIPTFLNNHPAIKKIAHGLFRYAEGLTIFILHMTGHIPSHTLRCAVYRIFGLKIGNKSYIYGRSEILSPRRIQIGKNTIIGHNAILDGRGGLEIGNNVNLSYGVWIWTAEHRVNDRSFSMVPERVVIEDYAWLSSRTVILPGVRIGYGAVVCAGAVVTKNIEPFSIVAGVPAKIIGERSKDLDYNPGSPLPFI